MVFFSVRQVTQMTLFIGELCVCVCVCVCVCILSCFSCVQLFATLWTIARQASLSKEFSKDAMPSSRGPSLPINQTHISLSPLHWQARFLPLAPPSGKPIGQLYIRCIAAYKEPLKEYCNSVYSSVQEKSQGKQWQKKKKKLTKLICF